MAVSRVLAGQGSEEPDVLREAVKSYKEAIREAKQDLNIGFFLKTLSVVNESSAIKLARNPVDSNGKWRRDAAIYNVRGFEIDDSGRLVVRTRVDKEELSVEKALDQLHKLRRKINNESVIVYQVSEHKEIQITDIYSHAFVKNAWAGLPFDLVLGYFEKEDEE